MSQDFLTMMKQIDAQHETISRELQGQTRVKQGKKMVWSIPDHEPRTRTSNTLTEIILQFYPQAVITRSGATTLLGIWVDEVTRSKSSSGATYKEIYKLLQPLLLQFYTKESSLSSQAVAWRRPVKERYGQNSDIYVQSIHILGLSRERALARRDEYKEKIRESVRNRNTVKYAAEDIYEIMDKAAASRLPIHNVVAVLLATGSRLIECIKISKYEAVDDRPDLIKVTGMAKDRGVWPSEKTAIRPLVRFSSDKVLSMIKKIRDTYEFSELPNAEAAGRIKKQLNSVIADYFAVIDENAPGHLVTTAHKLRYIWASMAYQLYGNGVPEQEWIREMFGHESSDTSLIYTQFVVNMDGGVEKRPVRQATRGHRPEARADNQIGRQVDHPEFENPLRIRLSKEEQLRMLEGLDNAYAAEDVRMTQRDARNHHFGSAIITVYWKTRKPRPE